MNDEQLDFELQDVPKYILNCPVVSNWIEYKGETFYAILNYERSLLSHRSMIDLSYCTTQALNGIVIKTVRYDRRKFKSSRLDK